MTAEKQANVDYDKQIQSIWESIDRVGLKQDEIKNYIIIIDQGLEILNTQLKLAQQPDIRMKIITGIQRNTELIAKLYDTISSFESIRQRYQQDISKLTGDKLRFIHIELKRLEDKMDTELSSSTLIGELRTLVQQINSSREIVEKTENELKKNPEYNMN